MAPKRSFRTRYQVPELHLEASMIVASKEPIEQSRYDWRLKGHRQSLDGAKENE